MGFENKTHNGVNYKQSDRALEWKLIYKGADIIYMDYSSCVATTCQEVYSYPTFRNIMNHVKNNDLDVSSTVLDDYDRYYNNIVGDAVLPNDNDLIEFLNTFTFEENEIY